MSKKTQGVVQRQLDETLQQNLLGISRVEG